MGSRNREAREAVENGRTTIGIELGSTRIKAVLIGEDYLPLASGSCSWESSRIDGIWTYSLEEVEEGLQTCFSRLSRDTAERWDTELKRTEALGISAMMHGYLVFDAAGTLLAPFRTWRNTITADASRKLTELFSYPIPQRWSIAHLYQALLNGEEHVHEIASMTTLSGYVHRRLTGKNLLGIGDASGMFPIDSGSGSYSRDLVQRFNREISSFGMPWELESILPAVLRAGDPAGELTPAGALLLDPGGTFEPGVPLCPPEGDAGTGMTATNSTAVRSGNVSAGTSVFAMVVLEKKLSQAYEEIDLVTTPDGSPVAMVHANNCTADYDAWIHLFKEALASFGVEPSESELYDTLLGSALEGRADCGGLLSYGYLAGEHITGFDEGRPLFVRPPGSSFTLPNFMRTLVSTALGALRIGMDILYEREGVRIDTMSGHGGFFKAGTTGRSIMAAALDVPVTVLETAGEGGSWGAALLAAYMKSREPGLSLSRFLAEKVFCGYRAEALPPEPDAVEGFNLFMQRYRKGLAVERAAVEYLPPDEG